ncbi:MAG: acyl carrier protein [Desulfuromonadales bacterium]|nr:acyl carrier protein [Desulfuromonadales bacterium]
MDIINEMKTLLLKIGVEESVVADLTQYLPLAGHIVDSVGYNEFVAALEERFGIVVDDPGAAYIRSLNDFKLLIESKS